MWIILTQLPVPVGSQRCNRIVSIPIDMCGAAAIGSVWFKLDEQLSMRTIRRSAGSIRNISFALDIQKAQFSYLIFNFTVTSVTSRAVDDRHCMRLR